MLGEWHFTCAVRREALKRYTAQSRFSPPFVSVASLQLDNFSPSKSTAEVPPSSTLNSLLLQWSCSLANVRRMKMAANGKKSMNAKICKDTWPCLQYHNISQCIVMRIDRFLPINSPNYESEQTFAASFGSFCSLLCTHFRSRPKRIEIWYPALMMVGVLPLMVISNKFRLKLRLCERFLY